MSRKVAPGRDYPATARDGHSNSHSVAGSARQMEHAAKNRPRKSYRAGKIATSLPSQDEQGGLPPTREYLAPRPDSTAPVEHRLPSVMQNAPVLPQQGPNANAAAVL